MLNLRQLNKTDNAQSHSDAQRFSQFSVEFRVPSDLLGNIGEPLDHSQAERLHEDGPEDREAAAEEQLGSAGDPETAGPVGGPPSTRWEDNDSVPLDTSWLAAGPPETRSVDDEEKSLGFAGSSTRSPGNRCNEVSGAGALLALPEAAQLRRLMGASFADAGDRCR